MFLKIPVDVFHPIQFESVQKWTEDRITFIKDLCLKQKGMPPLVFYIFKEGDFYTEKIIYLQDVINDNNSKDLISKLIPEKLQEDKAIACVSTFEAWTRDEKTNDILSEVLMINCEYENNSKMYMFEINRINEFTLKDLNLEYSDFQGRFSRFLNKEIKKDPNFKSIEVSEKDLEKYERIFKDDDLTMN